jgi:deoxyuridine 5'-triphosphate nucleotidohydrolase
MSLKNRSKDFSNYENRESFPQVAPQTNDELGSLRFKKLDQRATLPTRGSSQSAGLDLYSIEEVAIAPRERALVRTGLAVAIPEAHYGRIAPRSGLALRTGLDVLSGVIDADYRGEIGCLLYNTGDETINLPAQSKICQLIIEKIIMPTPVWADDISETERGSGGFGSTG